MSLAINTDDINEVLLPDGQWHIVRRRDDGRAAFDIDAYEFLEGNSSDSPLVLGGGQSGICSTGAQFELIGVHEEIKGKKSFRAFDVVACPMTSVLAVKFRRKKH